MAGSRGIGDEASVEEDLIEGGDAACWAHLVEGDERERRLGACTPGVVSVSGLAAEAQRSGPLWTGSSDDLNVNLLSFPPGEGVAEHVNSELDVLLIGIAGQGAVTINGEPQPFGAGDVILVVKGTRRGIRAGEERLAYLTCHRRRIGLTPTLPPRNRF